MVTATKQSHIPLEHSEMHNSWIDKLASASDVAVGRFFRGCILLIASQRHHSDISLPMPRFAFSIRISTRIFL